ncbi:DUF6521 family protein [Sphingomonas sp. SM33]|uniref:DUF6521 family protein n=1 Tax=Sphingomonas telluris TaxID=2907998 RepID=A0ABS9VQ92_9SPHN|nr:three component ABC system middle component [Sphingomonas telluris]MCH8616689.1 DUF6521 family protein [Sphingomonas telluris]
MADQWAGRERIRLLNPAFTGATIARATEGYVEVTGSGLPFAYAYLIAPFVLHSETRSKLPGSLATRLLPWTEKFGEVIATFPQRVAELSPYSSKGILLATLGGLAELSGDASLFAKPNASLKRYTGQSGSTEVENILKKSHFVGKWLAAAGTPATVFTALGVRFEDHYK